MKQPIIYFLFYFKRFSEVKKIRNKQSKNLLKLNSSKLIKEKDKTKISELIYKLANPKSAFFFSPLKTINTEIPWVREIQEILATYLPLAKSKEEYVFIEKLLLDTNDYFRYHEMFEQNILFWMFIIVVITIIISPIITSLV